MFYEHVCAGRLAPRVFVNSCQRPSDENITDISSDVPLSD